MLCRRTTRLAGLLVVLAAMAWGVQLPASADAHSLVVSGDVRVVPPDTHGLPMLVPDGPAGIGYVLSSTQPAGWNRVQAVVLRTRRAASAVAPIPALDLSTPLVIDSRRHLLIYAEQPPPFPVVDNGASRTPAVTNLVGLGLRGGSVRVLFRVQTRLSVNQPVAGLALDDAGNDLLLVAAVDESPALPNAGVAVNVDRLSIDGLLQGKLTARWTQPYQLPSGRCGAMIDESQPAGLLVVGTHLYFACGRPRPDDAGDRTSSLGPPGVVSLSGVTAQAAPTISDDFFPMPGDVAGGVTFADRATRRFVIVSALTGGYLMRVFDTDHGRYVGTIKGTSNPAGFASDPRTGRLYFAGAGTGGAALGHADLAALVPTQGEMQSDPFSGILNARPEALRMTFDGVGRRLYLPRYDTSTNPPVFSIIAVRDDLPRYTAPPALDPDLGAVDTVERPGLTDSNRSSSARAFGADYQLVGGATNLVQNTAGDTGSTLRPGTRSLRQAYVKQSSLGSDGSAAVAVSAEEDRATDADRGGAPGAGTSFVAPALCADFGSSPTTQPVVVASAQVSCNLSREQTVAEASYTAEDSVLLTTQGTAAPVPAPVQVGRSVARVQMSRPGDTGPLGATITASADNVSILGIVSLAKVTSTVAVATHGRTGTAIAAAPVVTVTGAEINGKPACAAPCPPDALEGALNNALAGRAHIEFPHAMVTRSKHGSFVSVAQDPWYHAERVLDVDKDDDDYAVPAMTIVVYLDRSAKSRLVVDLAGVAADAAYRIFALDRFTGGPPDAAAPGGSALLPHGLAAPPPGAPDLASGLPPATAASGAPQQGLVSDAAARLRLALRSPRAALPLLLIWALLGLPEYLAARRRLLLELPMLTREQDIA